MISSAYTLKFKHFFTLCNLSDSTKMLFNCFQFTLILFASTYFVATELGYIHRLSSDMEPLEKYSLCTLNDIEDNNCDLIVLLEMDYKNHHLISCSSQGHCLAHSEENISKIVSHKVEPALEVKESALRAFHCYYPDTDTEMCEKWNIDERYMLTTFVGLTLLPTFSMPFSVLYTSNQSFVNIRSLNPNAFGLLLGQVNVCTKAIRKIVYGFGWGNFGYLLTINKTFHSHIARIEHQNGTYSGDDLAIVCRKSESGINSQFRTVVKAFTFASNSTAEDVLFVIFQLLNTFNDAEQHVLCMYSVNEINNMFAIQSTLRSNGQNVKTMALIAQSLHANYKFTTTPDSIVAGLVNDHYVLFIGLLECCFVKISIIKSSAMVFQNKKICTGNFKSNTTLHGTTMFLYGKDDGHELYKIQVHNCYQHNTSFACLEIQDPYCGWCFSTSKCCLKSECSNNGTSTNWVSYDIDTYIALSRMTNTLFQQTVQTNVTLAFTGLLPFANHIIIFCIFKFNDSFVLNTTTTNHIGSSNINCTIPDLIFFPWKPFYAHHITAQLSLAAKDFPKFVQNIPMVFYNCQTYKICAACLTSNYPCNWNIDEDRCAHESTWNNNNIFVIGNYNSNSTKLHQYCPTFKTKGDELPDIFIKADLVNHTKQVVSVNISVPLVLKDKTFTCNFIITDTVINEAWGERKMLAQFKSSRANTILPANASRTILVDATKSHNIEHASMFSCILTCLVEKLVNNINKSVTKVELEISSQGNRTYLHNEDRVRLVVVSCTKIGMDCKKCIRYQCGWCLVVGKCSEELLCNNTWIKKMHVCKATNVIISNFTPNQSPVEGGTSISITTMDNNFYSFLPFMNSVTVSGVLCNIDARYTASDDNQNVNNFFCTLQQFDPKIHNFSGPVIVNCSTGIFTSENNFTFFDPQVNDLIPKNGPQCGGTNVTIYGAHLNISEKAQVFLDDLECVVFARYLDKLQCITSPSRRSFRSKVMVIFSSKESYNCNRTLNNITFHYDQNMKANDAIRRVPRGIPAGGIDIHVSGENLTLYGEIALEVGKDPDLSYTDSSDLCKILNTTFMICPSPNLENMEFSMNIDNEKIPKVLNYQFSYSTSKKSQKKHTSHQQINSLPKLYSDLKFSDPTPDMSQETPSSHQQNNPIPKLYPYFLLYPNSLKNVILEIDEKQQTNWLIENIYLIIIGTIMVVALIVVIVVIKFRKMAKTSKKMQRRINKMGLETIAMSEWIKRVVIEKNIELDENEQIMLKLPNVTIEPTTVPRITDDQVLQEMEYELPLDDTWEFDRSNLTLGKCLGQGEFGIVVKGKATGIVEQNLVTTVAVKMLKSIHTDVDMICLVSEMELMKLIARRRHNNVLCLLGCCTQNGPLLVITEYAQHGSLLNFLRKHEFATTDEVMPGQLNNKMLINFALQVAKGMDHLASIRCIHRDLAARNILITENYTMKISDFGLARDVRGKYYYQHKSNARVPVRWMAPEAIHRGRNTTKSDVWSYGILFWEIVTLGSVPYSSFVDVNKLLLAIKSGYRMEKPKNCSMEMYEVMRRCWNNQPDDRPTFTEIVVLLEEMLGNAQVCEPEEIMLE